MRLLERFGLLVDGLTVAVFAYLVSSLVRRDPAWQCFALAACFSIQVYACRLSWVLRELRRRRLVLAARQGTDSLSAYACHLAAEFVGEPDTWGDT